MKKVLLSLAAVTAIAAATPAAADHDGRYGRNDDRGYGYGYQVNGVRQINERQALLAQRLDRAIQRGEINRWEARELTGQLRYIEVLERRYRRDGLARSEFVALNQRLDHLQASIQNARRNHDRRYDYGYNRW